MTIHFTSGGRQYSLEALVEKIEYEFALEVRNHPDLLNEASEPAARRDLIRDVLDYVLATESILINRPDRLVLLNTVYNNLFGFGPLHAYLGDEAVTEISIDAPDRVYVRHGAGDRVSVPENFTDLPSMERAIDFILATASVSLHAADPIVEVGTVIDRRPVRIAAVMPPASSGLQVNLRLHPVAPGTLDSLVAKKMLDDSASRLLKAILGAGSGLMIAGEPGSGKTTLLEALLPHLPTSGMVVERAAEMRLPNTLMGLLPTNAPQVIGAPIPSSVSFPDRLAAALTKYPGCLVVDEIRFDEAVAMWDALTMERKAQLLWAFRGSSNPLRLKAAFSMSVRRARPGIEQEFIYSALRDRLPFVALTVRRDQKLCITAIGEWQPDGEHGEDVRLVTLWPGAGAAPSHRLDWTP